MKWFCKLRKSEIWQMHRDVVYEDIRKRCEVDKQTGECTFYEHWDSGYIPTSYLYDDFDVICRDAMGDEGPTFRRYIKWMTERFGREYLADYLSYKTGVESRFFLEHFSSDGKPN